MGRWSYAVLGVGALWVAGAGCTVEAIDLEGKKCPCADGYYCDPNTGTCKPGDKPSGGSGGTDGGSGSGGSAGSGGLSGGGGVAGSGGLSGGGGVGGGVGGTGGGVGGSGGTAGTGGGSGGVGGGTGGTGGCLTTQKLCNGSCVSKYSTTYGCASTTSCSPCPAAPSGTNSTAACTGTGPSCGISCTSSNYGNCDGQASNGCETPLNASDPANCGKCNRTCSTTNASSATCSGSSCNTACNPGYGNCNESSKLVPDDGCESNLSSDSSDCGACGNSCGVQGGMLSKFSCFGGSCGCSSGLQCEGSNGMSGVSCNTANHVCQCDAATCNKGEICIKSGPNAVCSCNGAAACSAGSTCCNSGCVNPMTDVNNCGGCGRKCGLGQLCSNGTCVT